MLITSPLRYPGGKAKLYSYFSRIINQNNLFSSTYCEPYAGGAGLALKLLASGFVSSVALNDIDKSIFAFWKVVLGRTEEFCDKIIATPVDINEWYRQKDIWDAQDQEDDLALGFSAYYLNRTNRSGIIEGAGPIGGYKQSGEWKLDVRFNKISQISNIKNLSKFKDRIKVYNSDALDFLKDAFCWDDPFVYLDPPYYVKGSKLYKNFYLHGNHCQIRDLLKKNLDKKWVVSYDDVPEISEIYADFEPTRYSLNYSAGAKGVGSEVMFFSNSLVRPDFVSENATDN